MADEGDTHDRQPQPLRDQALHEDTGQGEDGQEQHPLQGGRPRWWLGRVLDRAVIGRDVCLGHGYLRNCGQWCEG